MAQVYRGAHLSRAWYNSTYDKAQMLQKKPPIDLPDMNMMWWHVAFLIFADEHLL